MKDTKVKIIIESKKLVGKELTGPEFVDVVRCGVALLQQAVISALGKNSKYDFTLTDMSHSSPACLEFTLPSTKHNVEGGRRVLDKLKEQEEDLQSAEVKDVPLGFLGEFERAFVAPAKKKISVKFEDGNGRLILNNDNRTVQAIKRRRLKGTKCPTYAVGKLEWLSIHGRKQQLKIFPAVKEWKSTTVGFGDEFKKDVIESIGEMVKVDGLGSYRPGAFLPHHIQMSSIEHIADGSGLRKLSELHGAYPDITGGQSVDEFLRKLRAGKD